MAGRGTGEVDADHTDGAGIEDKEEETAKAAVAGGTETGGTAAPDDMEGGIDAGGTLANVKGTEADVTGSDVLALAAGNGEDERVKKTFLAPTLLGNNSNVGPPTDSSAADCRSLTFCSWVFSARSFSNAAFFSASSA